MWNSLIRPQKPPTEADIGAFGAAQRPTEANYHPSAPEWSVFLPLAQDFQPLMRQARLISSMVAASMPHICPLIAGLIVAHTAPLAAIIAPPLRAT